MLSFTNRVALFFGWKPASAQHDTLPTIMSQPAAKIAAAVKQPAKTTAKATATPTKLDKPPKTASTTVAKADSGVDVAEPTYPAKTAIKVFDANSRSLLLDTAQVEAADDGSIVITIKDKMTISFNADDITRCLQRNVTGKHVQLDLKIDSPIFIFNKDYAHERDVARAAVASVMLATKMKRAAAKAARLQAKKANRSTADSDSDDTEDDSDDTEDDSDDNVQDDDFSACKIVLRASQALETYDDSGVEAVLAIFEGVYKYRPEDCDLSGRDSFEWFGM
ncbi:hypothetical protein BC831DRAFT_515739 [Entophlyctis helioformis]|nr:hypothetical protein BC831DRAFT_515739 [Entophlyctis helioformis]